MANSTPSPESTTAGLRGKRAVGVEAWNRINRAVLGIRSKTGNMDVKFPADGEGGITVDQYEDAGSGGPFFPYPLAYKEGFTYDGDDTDWGYVDGERANDEI